jgi:hypothetical protein
MTAVGTKPLPLQQEFSKSNLLLIFIQNGVWVHACHQAPVVTALLTSPAGLDSDGAAAAFLANEVWVASLSGKKH